MKIITKIILLVFIIFSISSVVSSQVYNNCDIYGNCAPEGLEIFKGDNVSINVNSSDYWVTSIGSLDNVNDTQFNSISQVLNLDESWADSKWCQLVGCTMTGNLEMDDSKIILTSTATGIQRLINYTAESPLAFGSIGIQNDVGSSIVMAIFGSQIGLFENDSGLLSSGGRTFIATLNNESILFGGSPDDDLNNILFGVSIDPTLGALVLRGNQFIRPAIFDDGVSMLFQSVNVLPAGSFPFIWVAQDSNNDTIITSWHQNGKNNTFSGYMNSQVDVPKSWITFIGNVTDDEEGILFLENRSNYQNYCDYLQNNLSLIPEGCQYFADTVGRLVPMRGVGDLEVHRTAAIHEGITLFNNFDFIGRNGNDVDLLFNGALESGKFHIRDKRQIEANIIFFDRVITDFDDGTINPFVIESILPEIGRDWNSVLEDECHENRCANSKGGNEKIMSFSASTQFENRTVASSNTRLMFWITSLLSGADLFEVEIDDNQGNVSSIYSTSTVLVDQFINVSFPSLFENKSNVTTRFILNGQNANREVWVDIIRVTSEPSQSIIINESFDGGRAVIGEDRGNLSCAIEVDKIINNDTLDTEWEMSLGCPEQNTNIKGNLTINSVKTFTGNCINASYVNGLAVACND